MDTRSVIAVFAIPISQLPGVAAEEDAQQRGDRLINTVLNIIDKDVYRKVERHLGTDKDFSEIAAEVDDLVLSAVLRFAGGIGSCLRNPADRQTLRVQPSMQPDQLFERLHLRAAHSAGHILRAFKVVSERPEELESEAARLRRWDERSSAEASLRRKVVGLTQLANNSASHNQCSECRSPEACSKRYPEAIREFANLHVRILRAYAESTGVVLAVQPPTEESPPG